MGTPILNQLILCSIHKWEDLLQTVCTYFVKEMAAAQESALTRFWTYFLLSRMFEAVGEWTVFSSTPYAFYGETVQTVESNLCVLSPRIEPGKFYVWGGRGSFKICVEYTLCLKSYVCITTYQLTDCFTVSFRFSQ